MRTHSTSTRLLVVLALVTLLAGVASANVNGAIFTTTSTGTTVNGNIYDAKTSVYLNGGPQNKKDPGLTDGTYYFQVTDPSGAVLLSADDISCRQVVVSGGRIVGVPAGTAPANCTSTAPAGAFHPLGTTDPSNGQTPVELCPATPSPRTDNLGNGSLFDASNWCDNTPNPGGEYKAWLTPVGNYSLDGSKCSSPSRVSYGFCDADSKTDNFKVRQANAAYVTVCKFNDLDGSGTQDPGEPLIPFWPINATGVDTLTGPLGTVNGETDATGCTSFSISTFPNPGPPATDTVTLNENVLSGWVETAPLPGTYDSNGVLTGTGPTSVAGFTETITVKAGDVITAPNFGNTCVNFDPVNGCGGNTIVLGVTKDANPSLTRTYSWQITKSVDTNTVYSAGGGTSGLANYTVTVTHDSGTDSGWQVTGTIHVSNPSLVDVTGVTVTDLVDNGGSCTVTGGTSVTVPASSEVKLAYTCTYSSLPANGTNTATALSTDGSFTGTASVNFSGATVKLVDNSVTVTDTLDGTLGTATINADGTMTVVGGVVDGTNSAQADFTYSLSFKGDPAGTCTSHPNTATFTTNTTSTTGTAGQTVKDCQGADLTVSKTATPAFNSSVAKSVNQTSVQQSGGSVTFNYTVTVTESAWTVSGTITVTNPNNWESITATVGDSLSDSGGVCVVNGGTTSITLAASGSQAVPYTCTFAARPSAVSGTNTATATWNAATAHTTDASASSLAVGYTFATLTITDNVQSSTHPSGCNATLGTVSVTTTTPSGSPGCSEVANLKSPSWGVFTYSITDSNSSPGTCTSYNNTAKITGGSSSNQVTVTVCNTNIGALTMGFWKNKNGQGIITGQAKTGTCPSGTYLRTFNSFDDLSATATCAQVASYVASTLGAATCGGSTCNPMLKAQMLATALDVYFSPGGGGGNKIGSFNGLGNATPDIGTVAVNLSNICSMIDTTTSSSCSGKFEDVRSEFGIAAPACQGATVNTMLAYANFLSGVNGSPVASSDGGKTWYKQTKNPNQVFAKDGFDNINNDIAPIASGAVCTSTF